MLNYWTVLSSISATPILSDYFGCSLDYLLKGSSSSDISSYLPASILKILREDESEEQELLLAYLNMYSRIKNLRN